MTTQSWRRRSPNVIYVGDLAWCSLYGWNGNAEKYPETAFGVDGPNVEVEAVHKSDDPLVDNEFTVPFSYLRRGAMFR